MTMTSPRDTGRTDGGTTTDEDVDRLPDSEQPNPTTTEGQAAEMDYEGDTPH